MRRGPYLPEGSGDAESPEELRASEVYAARMWLFENPVRFTLRKRRRFSDYTTKNCEEAFRARGRSPEADEVGD